VSPHVNIQLEDWYLLTWPNSECSYGQVHTAEAWIQATGGSSQNPNHCTSEVSGSWSTHG